LKYIIVVCILIVNVYGFSASSCKYSAEELSDLARKYKSAYDDYETAKSNYELEKSSYEIACSSWGYLKNDEFACGTYGYLRSAYEDAYSTLKTAISDLEYAESRLANGYSDVESDCDINNNLGRLFLSFKKKEQKLKSDLQKCEENKNKLKKTIDNIKKQNKKSSNKI